MKKLREKIMQTFDEWKLKNCAIRLVGTGVQTCWTDWKLEQAYNAGISEGESRQRERDAVIAFEHWNNGNPPCEVAQAIRKAKDA